jgi:hypothetical protein
MHCSGKPDETHSIDVGDHAGHTYMIDKGTCTYTTSPEIAGVKVKEQTGVSFTEIDGKKFRYHGSNIGSMENGDKFYSRNQGSVATPGPFVGTWNFTGGTGKFKGLKVKEHIGAHLRAATPQRVLQTVRSRASTHCRQNRFERRH